MTARSFSQIFTMLMVMLCFHTTTTAQVRRDTPITSVTAVDCSFTKSIPPINIQEMSSQTLSAMPIPSSGLVKVTDMNYERYSVTDSQGEMWVAGPGTKDHTIDLGHLPTGVYYLHLSSKDGESVRTVVKAK